MIGMHPDADTAARDKEAMVLLRHALSVRAESLGDKHPLTVATRRSIAYGERCVASRR